MDTEKAKSTYTLTAREGIRRDRGYLYPDKTSTLGFADYLFMKRVTHVDEAWLT